MIDASPAVYRLTIKLARRRTSVKLLIDNTHTSLVVGTIVSSTHRQHSFRTTKKEPSALSKFLKYFFVAGPEGIEPSTDGFGDHHSTN